MHAGGNDRRHPLAEIVARKVVFLFFQRADLAGIIVKHLGNGGFKANLVRPALAGGNVVHKGKQILRIGIRILDRHAQSRAIALAFKEDRLADRVFFCVEILHKILQPTGKQIFAVALVRIFLALVLKHEFDAAVEIGQFAQASSHRFAGKMGVLKHARVGLEAHNGAALARVAQLGQGRDGLAGEDLAVFVRHALKALLIMRVILIHIHREPFGKRVHHAGAHAVQAAGIGIIFVVEFAARVQLGVHHFHRGNPQLGVNAYGNAAAIVRHFAGAILIERDGNLRGIAIGRLVDGVVHNLPNHMVQPARARGTNVHSRAHAHRIQAFQYLNIACVVAFCHVNIPTPPQNQIPA